MAWFYLIQDSTQNSESQIRVFLSTNSNVCQKMDKGETYLGYGMASMMDNYTWEICLRIQFGNLSMSDLYIQ